MESCGTGINNSPMLNNSSNPTNSFMVIIKYIRSEIISSLEFHLDHNIHSLHNIVLENLHSKFRHNIEKSIYFLEFETNQLLIMDVLKGMTYYGWKLLTSHAFLSAMAMNTVETYFYYEHNGVESRNLGNLNVASSSIQNPKQSGGIISMLFNNNSQKMKPDNENIAPNNLNGVYNVNNTPIFQNQLEANPMLSQQSSKSGPYSFARRQSLLTVTAARLKKAESQRVVSKTNSFSIRSETQMYQHHHDSQYPPHPQTNDKTLLHNNRAMKPPIAPNTNIPPGGNLSDIYRKSDDAAHKHHENPLSSSRRSSLSSSNGNSGASSRRPSLTSKDQLVKNSHKDVVQPLTDRLLKLTHESHSVSVKHQPPLPSNPTRGSENMIATNDLNHSKSVDRTQVSKPIEKSIDPPVKKSILNSLLGTGQLFSNVSSAGRNSTRVNSVSTSSIPVSQTTQYTFDGTVITAVDPSIPTATSSSTTSASVESRAMAANHALRSINATQHTLKPELPVPTNEIEKPSFNTRDSPDLTSVQPNSQPSLPILGIKNLNHDNIIATPPIGTNAVEASSLPPPPPLTGMIMSLKSTSSSNDRTNSSSGYGKTIEIPNESNAVEMTDLKTNLNPSKKDTTNLGRKPSKSSVLSMVHNFEVSTRPTVPHPRKNSQTLGTDVLEGISNGMVNGVSVDSIEADSNNKEVVTMLTPSVAEVASTNHSESVVNVNRDVTFPDDSLKPRLSPPPPPPPPRSISPVPTVTSNKTVNNSDPIHESQGITKIKDETVPVKSANPSAPAPAPVITNVRAVNVTPIETNLVDTIISNDSFDTTPAPDTTPMNESIVKMDLPQNPLSRAKTMYVKGNPEFGSMSPKRTDTNPSVDPEALEAVAHENDKLSHYSMLGSAFLRETPTTLNRRGGRGVGMGRGAGLTSARSSNKLI